jgi:glycosyltransferase involved in cell wall biosynthesis
MRILQINTVANSGSTGRIAEEIGNILIKNGHESYIAFGRGNRPSNSNLIKIGTQKDIYQHGLATLLLDKHGLASKKATARFIETIDKLKPDLIGLHNIHGYFLNYPLLFKFIKEKNIPVVWTFHDCWPFTGHCSYFESVGCEKWKTHCEKCPLTGKCIFRSTRFKNNNSQHLVSKFSEALLFKVLSCRSYPQWSRFKNL